MSSYPIPEFTEIDGALWPEPLAATPEVVRAAFYTGEASEDFSFRVTRPDSWEIRGTRQEEGWFITRGKIGSGEGEFRAVPKGDPRAGGKSPPLWKSIFTNGDVHLFSALETVSLVLDFMEGDVELDRVGWMMRRL